MGSAGMTAAYILIALLAAHLKLAISGTSPGPSSTVRTTDYSELPFTDPDILGCCVYMRVPGGDSLAGLYTLHWGEAELLPECVDSCVYRKMGDSDTTNLYCFSSEGAFHYPVCEDPKSTQGNRRISNYDTTFVPKIFT